MANNSELNFYVAPDQHGNRLDKVISERQDSLSRVRIQNLIKKGEVEIIRNKHTQKIEDPAWRVKHDDEIILRLPPAEDTTHKGENIPLNVLYEDAALIVINKPSGMVVHPAPGHHSGTLVNALIAHCGDSLSGIGGQKRPGIVHRLDKDTSGVMVVAKTDTAHRALGEQFSAHGKDGRMQRSYFTFVWGRLLPVTGRVDAALSRHPHHRTKIHVSKNPKARFAVTHYKRLNMWGTPPVISLVECQLETGRTHQIRVHMAHIGHPIVSDALYGSSQITRLNTLAPAITQAIKAMSRQALHAISLGFEHPITHAPMSFTAPLPFDMARVQEALENHPNHSHD